MRRVAVGSVVIGLIAVALFAVPASANRHYTKTAPAVHVHVYANDDGRVSWADPGDVGDISEAYDRWGHLSSDDPNEAGMDASRLDGDVARCGAGNIGPQAIRMYVQNAYPGYVCTFAVVTLNRAGVNLVVEDIRIDVDTTLDLTTIAGPAVGDELKRRHRFVSVYSVRVLQEAPQGDTLEFDIEIEFAQPRHHPIPPRRCCCRWR